MRGRHLGIVATAFVLALSNVRAQQATEPAAVVREWFHHIERNAYDSPPPLLARGFTFEGGGTTYDAKAFVSMIEGLGIRSPKVELSDLETTLNGERASLTYRRAETMTMAGQTRAVVEHGTLALVREGGKWRIFHWTTRAD